MLRQRNFAAPQFLPSACLQHTTHSTHTHMRRPPIFTLAQTSKARCNLAGTVGGTAVPRVGPQHQHMFHEYACMQSTHTNTPCLVPTTTPNQLLTHRLWRKVQSKPIRIWQLGAHKQRHEQHPGIAPVSTHCGSWSWTDTNAHQMHTHERFESSTVLAMRIQCGGRKGGQLRPYTTVQLAQLPSYLPALTLLL